MSRRTGLAVVLAVAVAGTIPLAAAGDPLSAFQPTQVKAISISAPEMRALPPLDAFGTIRTSESPNTGSASSAAAVARQIGHPLRLPATLPAELAGASPSYSVISRTRSSFTFSESKSAAWARVHGVALQPLPAGLNGSTYTATLAPIALIAYGTVHRGSRQRATRAGDYLVVAQMQVPTIVSDGAPLSALIAWFASQPGIPPGLLEQVRAVGDPSRTVPIPIPFAKEAATPVHVDGVDGLALGDETGIGSAVVWTKNGVLYAVGATLAQSRTIDLANELK